MSALSHILSQTLQKFERRLPLKEADRAAFLRLPFKLRSVEPNQYILRDGDATTECCLILEGFVFRQKTTSDGARQILGLYIAGDFIDLEAALLHKADHNIQALTRCQLAMVPAPAIRQLMREHTRIAQAMWIDTLIDGSIFREWILNVGQRNALARVAHVICEFSVRMELAGLDQASGNEFPMTQEQLGDATGLSLVHVNRTLKVLENEHLIERKRRVIRIPDWHRLRDVGGFSSNYLHLDQRGHDVGRSGNTSMHPTREEPDR